jgi:hypothetical protein
MFLPTKVHISLHFDTESIAFIDSATNCPIYIDTTGILDSSGIMSPAENTSTEEPALVDLL